MHDSIPEELKQLPQWVCWRLQQRDGKSTKVPVDPKNPKRLAKTDDPTTWGTFEQACRTARVTNGIGFVFTAEGPYCGIDVDHVVDPELAKWFDSYAELSQSKTGTHIIIKARLPENAGRRSGRYEVYDSGRYFVMTGDVLHAAPIREAQPKLDEFLRDHFAAAVKEEAQEQAEPNLQGLLNKHGDAGDMAIVARAKAASNGEDFTALWEGHWQKRYKSQSEADAALLSHLRFWCQGDKDTAFRLFRQSGLMRDKFNRPDYRDKTWSMVDHGDVWSPPPSAAVVTDMPLAVQPFAGSTAMPDELLAVPGAMRLIAEYYNSTARMPQPGFAVQTALAVVSVLLGRRFRTDQDNYSSLYLLNIAKSSTGKEHGKYVAEGVLTFLGRQDLIGGSGYTSPGAVFTALRQHPVHLTVIDEYGKYLEAQNDRNATYLQQANRLIMEVHGRLAGVLRPQAYSTASLSRKDAEDVEAEDRNVVRPALSVLAMTTPDAFYSAVTSHQIRDGFLGRFLAHTSDLPRAVPRYVAPDQVPDAGLKQWLAAIDQRQAGNLTGVAAVTPGVVPEPVMLRFTDEAKTMLTAFATDMLTLMNSLDRVRMSALAGRAAEHAMRLALIAALARDPLADEITAQDAKWAVEYVRFLVTQIVQQTRRCVADSPWEKLKLDALAAIRELGERGITARDLPKTKPFSTMKPQDRNSVLNELQQAGLIAHGRLPSQTKPRTGWGAIASEKENDV